MKWTLWSVGFLLVPSCLGLEVTLGHSKLVNRADDPELWPSAPKAIRTEEDDGTDRPMATLALAPMAPLMWCLSSLAAQYIAVCSALGIARTSRQLQGRSDEEPSTFHRALESAELTLHFAPMLCVLFLAVQMQAMLRSNNHEDPPLWMCNCMEAASAALIVQTLLAVLAPMLAGRAEDGEEQPQLAAPVDAFDEDAVMVRNGPGWVRVSSAVATTLLMGASAAVCVGILSLRMPTEDGVGRIAPAVSYTVNLTLQLFVVHLALAAAANTLPKQRGRSGSKLLRVLKLAADTVFFAPALCVLFVGARVRALQVDGGQGVVQPWAVHAFGACSVSLLVQTVVVVTVPFLPGGDARRGASKVKGDVEIAFVSAEHGPAQCLFTLVRYAPCLALCASVVVVLASIITLASPRGQTPPLPPTIKCSIFLAGQFLLVHLSVWAARAACDFTGGRRFWLILVRTLHTATGTVQLCPMLAVLFLTLRLRAQEITGNVGAPQGWAQDAMYMCTGATLIQLAVCLLGGVLSAFRSQAGSSSFWRWALVGMQLVLVLVIYGGAVAVCVAFYMVTPATTGGYGGLLAFQVAYK